MILTSDYFRVPGKMDEKLESEQEVAAVFLLVGLRWSTEGQGAWSEYLKPVDGVEASVMVPVILTMRLPS